MADIDSIPGKSPAFQFYPNDFVSGTVTFTTEEVGAYILLLCHCWDKGRIPSDLRLVARIARLSSARMRMVWQSLEDKFVEVDGGYIQPRLEREREKQQQWREKSAIGGRKAQANRKGGSTTVATKPEPPDQPKADSSVFSLPSSSSDFRQGRIERVPTRAHYGPGAGAGSNPRDHLVCRGHGTQCERVCVSEKQHAILRQRYGRTPEEADRALDAFYAEVRASLDPEIPIGDTPWKFWEAQFAARFGTVAGVGNPKTAGNQAAVAQWLRRQG